MEIYRVSELTEKEIQTYKRVINISDTQTFDHYDTINRINNYKNDKFHKNTEADTIFWNLAKPRVPHFVKKINLKPRNFRMYAKGNLHSMSSWIINQRFQKWGKDSHFTLDLEDLKHNVAEYGEAVMKLVDQGSVETLEGENIDKYNLKRCHFTSIYYDTTVEDIIESQSIIEKHELSEAQIRKKMKAWGLEEEDIDHIKKHADTVKGTEGAVGIKKYILYERHGWFNEGENEMYDSRKKPEYTRHVFIGKGDNELILYKEKMDVEDCPYLDFHGGNYDGRHLRVGVYERLFQIQKRANQLVNENKQASTIASLLLFKSMEDDLTGVNLIAKAQSGQIIKTADLQQIGIDNRFLQNFLNELLMIEKQADQLCMTPDVASTKDPENSPVRSRILSINEISSAFETLRTRIAFKLSEVLIKRILPSLVAEWNKEDMFEISTNVEDVRIYDFYFIQNQLTAFIKEEFKKGRNPSPEEQQAFLASQTERLNIEGRRIKNLKGYFNFDYGLYMNPDDSDMDRGQMNEIIFNALSMFQANPAITSIPLFRQYLEMNNIPSFRLSVGEMQQFGQTQSQKPETAPKRDKLLSEVNQ